MYAPRRQEASLLAGVDMENAMIAHRHSMSLLWVREHQSERMSIDISTVHKSNSGYVHHWRETAASAFASGFIIGQCHSFGISVCS